MWLARHTPTTILPKLHKLLDSLSQEFADCVEYGQGIYGCGYCFGGKYILLLCAEQGDDVVAGQKDPSATGEEEQGMKKHAPRLKAGVLAHGTMVAREDFVNVKSPIGMVCVENDGLFPDDVREEGVKSIKEKGGEIENWVHPGVPHG